MTIAIRYLYTITKTSPNIMLPKAKYMKLSPAEKAKVKRKLGMSSGKAKSFGSKLKGHGDYLRFNRSGLKSGSPFTRVSDPDEGLGGQIGGYFGKVGRKVGGAAHKLFKSITGYGDYNVRSNSLITGNEPARFSSNGRGTIIQHREYLGNILSTTGFTVQSFPINAGLIGTFPWASAIAGQFEQYCISGMVFQYRTTSATSLTSGASTAMGSVIMATSYDSVSPTFSTESQMLNHEYSTSCVPSKDAIHPIECARGETPVSCLYTRTGPVPTGADPRLYDLGNFQIATIGQQNAGDVIGQLWCTYVIELLKPQLASSGVSPTADHYQFTPTAPGGVVATFGPSNTKTAASNLGTSLNSTTRVLTFPTLQFSVNYLLSYVVSLSTSSAIGTALVYPTLSTGLVSNALFKGGTQPYAGAAIADQIITYVVECSISVPANTAGTATFATWQFAGAATIDGQGDLIISAIPAGVFLKTPVLARSERKASLPLPSEDNDEDSSDEEDDMAEYLRFKALAKKAKSKPRRKPESDDDLVKVSEPTPPMPTITVPVTPSKVTSRK